MLGNLTSRLGNEPVFNVGLGESIVFSCYFSSRESMKSLESLSVLGHRNDSDGRRLSCISN